MFSFHPGFILFLFLAVLPCLELSGGSWIDHPCFVPNLVGKHSFFHCCCCCCCWVASVVSDSVRPHRRQPTRLPRPWDSPGKNTGVGCHCHLQCMKVKSESEVAQSWLTLSDPTDCSPPGSSAHGIFQARVLEWGAISFSTFTVTYPIEFRFLSKCSLSCCEFLSSPCLLSVFIYLFIFTRNRCWILSNAFAVSSEMIALPLF